MQNNNNCTTPLPQTSEQQQNVPISRQSTEETSQALRGTHTSNTTPGVVYYPPVAVPHSNWHTYNQLQAPVPTYPNIQYQHQPRNQTQNPDHPQKPTSRRGSQAGLYPPQGESSSHTTKRADHEQRIGDYIIKKTLGKGAFSKVCLAEHRKTHQKYALKFIKPLVAKGDSVVKHKIRIEREITLLSLLYHPNIVKLYDVNQTSRFTMIVMEHNSGGELLHYVRQKGRLHENEARGFFRQIVSAMDYIHRNCMVHRDLKLENVMLTHDNRIRIIDFGFANIFNWDKTLSTFCGSPLYISPEIVNGVKYTGPEVDIWSMGVILFFMVSGCMPFESQERKEVFYKIARGRFTMPMFLSTEAQNLIQQMLTVSSKYRITMKGVIEHPWTNKDYSELINNYLPYRSPVVFQPNEQTLQKMRIYKYNIESTISALARSDMMYTPIVCIYHLIEEARLRKELRAKRQAQALHLGRHREGGSAATSGLSSPVLQHALSHTARGYSNEGKYFALQSPTKNSPEQSAFENLNQEHTSTGLAAAASGTSHLQRRFSGIPFPMTSTGLPVPIPQYPTYNNTELDANIDQIFNAGSQNDQPRLSRTNSIGKNIGYDNLVIADYAPTSTVVNEKPLSKPARLFSKIRQSMNMLKVKSSQLFENSVFSELRDDTNADRYNRDAPFSTQARRFSVTPMPPPTSDRPQPRV